MLGAERPRRPDVQPGQVERGKVHAGVGDEGRASGGCLVFSVLSMFEVQGRCGRDALGVLGVRPGILAVASSRVAPSGQGRARGGDALDRSQE